MAFVDEGLPQSEDVMLVVGITFLVQHSQYLHFHHALVEVRWLVLDDFNSNNLVRFHVLTLDDLTKGSLAENVEDEVFVMTLVLAQPIINVEDVVVIFVIESVVMDWFTWFRQNASRVMCCFITEGRIADAVGRYYMRR